MQQKPVSGSRKRSIILQKSAIDINRTSASQRLQKLQTICEYLCVVLFTSMVSLGVFIALSNRGYHTATELGQALSTVASNLGIGQWIAKQLLYVNLKQLVITFLAFAGLLWIGFSIMSGKTKLIRFCYRNRYLIALIVLIVSVLFKLNGNSFYSWSELLSGGELYRPLFGTARAVRSDDWAVWSTFTISQGFRAGPPSVRQSPAAISAPCGSASAAFPHGTWRFYSSRCTGGFCCSVQSEGSAFSGRCAFSCSSLFRLNWRCGIPQKSRG